MTMRNDRCRPSRRHVYLVSGVTLVVAMLSHFALGEARTGTASSDDVRPINIGEQVPADVTFTDIRYLPRTLDELGERQAYVFVFTTLDCPIVRRYLPRLRRLDEAYRDRGVQFVSINVGPEDAIVEIAYQAVKADIAFPFCKDFGGRLARQLGITRTPQVVVLDAERKLRYRGRIDDQIRFAGPRPQASREDLKKALEAVLAGRPVEVPETKPDGCLVTFAKDRQPAKSVTFHEHIAPILRTHCQDCHRPKTAAPFSLLTYEDATNHAEMIAEVVHQRRMPPWFASSEHGDFKNRRGLSAKERSLVADWVRGDRAAGEAPDSAPADEGSVEAPSTGKPDELESRIGKPDLVLTMTKPKKIPAEGIIDYHYFMLPYVFQEDTWIQSVDVMPGNRDVVHHCNLLYVVPGFGKYSGNLITGYVPGGDAMILDRGIGYLIPKGSRLVLQIHYVTAGYETEDATRVGIVYSKQRIDKQSRFVLCDDNDLAIAPGDPHSRSVIDHTFEDDVTVHAMFSHMHYRGKDMTFRAFYPDGRKETLLAVPNYSFDWQLAYKCRPETVKFPAGTKFEVVAHFDNSPFNPYNPDPTKTVRVGRQSFFEMMYGFVFYTKDDEHLDLEIDPHTGWVVAEETASEASGGE